MAWKFIFGRFAPDSKPPLPKILATPLLCTGLDQLGREYFDGVWVIYHPLVVNKALCMCGNRFTHKGWKHVLVALLYEVFHRALLDLYVMNRKMPWIFRGCRDGTGIKLTKQAQIIHHPYSTPTCSLKLVFSHPPHLPNYHPYISKQSEDQCVMKVPGLGKLMKQW